MKPIDKLREILCTVDEIKEDLMELRFGCKAMVNYSGEIQEQIIDSWVTTKYIDGKPYLRNQDGKRDLFITKIIGNNLEERHLRMYCDSKEIKCIFYGDVLELGYMVWKEFIQLDNTKSLQNQSDEIIQQIIDFLKQSHD